MNSDAEEVKSRINIADLVGEYVRLTKAGSNWRALCPFHNEKTPSFMVSEERGSFHCFGCGKGGDIFTFVMEMEGVGFREALEQLAQKAGVSLKKFEGKRKEEESVKPRLYGLLDLSAKWYEKNLWEGKERSRILKYLKERGLSEETIKKFRLGYAPDGWRNMLNFLVKRGFEKKDILKTGLLVEKKASENLKPESGVGDYYDRFRGRIMFPVQDIMGRVIGFSARIAPGGDEKNAKYINTPQTELYDKSKILYGLNFAKAEIKKRDEAILVEGNMDVIASHQAGFPNTIAVSGTALTSEQIRSIKRYTNNLKMAFDMDTAGQAAAKRSARICLENDLDVRMILLPSSKDAADLVKNDGKSWGESIEKSRSVVEYYFEDVFSRHNAKNPTDKKKIAKEILNIVKDIANPIEQSHWLKVLAEKLDTEERVLADVLRKAERINRKPEVREKDGEEKKTEKGNFLEKRLLGIILAFPSESKRLLEGINPDEIRGEKERKILEEILKEKENYGLDSIKSSLYDYEAEKLLDEAVFEIEVEAEIKSKGRDLFDPKGEMKLCLERIRKQGLKRKIARITANLKEAENAGDKNSVKTLMEEFRSLASRIGE